MSLKLSYPEKTNLYLTNLNNKSKIDVLIPDGVLKCESYEDFYINVIQFNTFHNFYNVIEGYNNKFNIIIDNSTNITCSIPDGNINAFTIREYINNHSILKNHIFIVYDKLKNIFEFQKISSSSLQLQIINAHILLGFSKTENIIEIPCKSSKPINVMSITNIFLHLEAGYDLNINDGNLDNHKGDRAQSNSILLSLPINQMYNNMIVYNNEDGGNSFMFKCNRQESITSLSVSIRDQFGVEIPNFPDSHLILQFSKKLREDKYGSILEKILDYITKISLIISYYFMGNENLS
jgi:hypothetical protein